MKIACTHPGKMGDTLWSIPTIKKLCELLDCKADFYTSSYCAPLRRLFEAQPYIDKFIVPENYVIERMDIGVQPYRMPVDISLYEKVYHLGFRGVPDKAIPEFIAHSAGLGEIGPMELKCWDIYTLPVKYYVLAPRGETTYKKLFKEFAEISPHPVVVIGGKGDYIGAGIDKTGLDFLETASWIKQSSGFVGLMSSQLVMAHAFPVTKVVPHDGKSWDMRHVVHTDITHYLVKPSVHDIIRLLT